MDTQIMPKPRLELLPVTPVIQLESSLNKPVTLAYKHNPFIEANTKTVSLSHLQKDCIIPVFSKDNEKTIAHQEFIEVVLNCTRKLFSHHSISTPEIRISHQIKGRTPSAIHKSAKDLLEHEKTIYYERMAFIIRVPSITENINGNELALTIGGVRAYNKENLYSKKSVEKFQVFIGFQNMVCCNLCISTDGFSSEMRVGSTHELASKIMELIESYDAEKHLLEMKQLTEYSLTEQQFAQLVGKSRLYGFLPKEQKLEIPNLLLNDGQISTIAKDYYQDERFCKNLDGTINLWNVYNLFTSANKSSYIDTFSDRNVNAFEFTNGLKNTLNGDSNYSWFLS
ncbi:hypothetical protein PK35_04430 [Tamlana nanhaiensis]|uniref:DUF3871 family protein n=1 Tax=Neotamlana nanhaiensis TaxID=1382798 RepID=A0A0D7W4M5_9FLAO|nr:DUF3871 family protein [Tamlana nanhaiensis]KJD33989.1 hypothetical protein PK35_04430 [Tamlana nanhaiensis]